MVERINRTVLNRTVLDCFLNSFAVVGCEKCINPSREQGTNLSLRVCSGSLLPWGGGCVVK